MDLSQGDHRPRFAYQRPTPGGSKMTITSALYTRLRSRIPVRTFFTSLANASCTEALPYLLGSLLRSLSFGRAHHFSRPPAGSEQEQRSRCAASQRDAEPGPTP